MARGPRGTGGTSNLRLDPVTNQQQTIKKSSKTNPDGTTKKQYGPKPVKIVASQEE